MNRDGTPECSGQTLLPASFLGELSSSHMLIRSLEFAASCEYKSIQIEVPYPWSFRLLLFLYPLLLSVFSRCRGANPPQSSLLAAPTLIQLFSMMSISGLDVTRTRKFLGSFWTWLNSKEVSLALVLLPGLPTSHSSSASKISTNFSGKSA